MKKCLKRVGYGLLTIAGILLITGVISYINHRIQRSKEDELFQPIGTLVEVNGHKMNVYVEGSGSTTLVFMSGGGTCSPVLDFKSLYSRLTDTYRIAVVEKAGYGFSEISDHAPRDIDTVLSETREALKLANVEGPFILCPHSMSGIEALYWAQKYPEEVTAIIGLDMAVPQSYEEYPINMAMVRISAFAAHIGITRWLPVVAESDAIKYGTLTEQEKEVYRAVFYRRTATLDMLNEVKEIKTSAKKVATGTTPSIPILIFSSNGEGTGWSKEKWRAAQNAFLTECGQGRMIELVCSHYVHDLEYERIEEEIRKYLVSN